VRGFRSVWQPAMVHISRTAVGCLLVGTCAVVAIGAGPARAVTSPLSLFRFADPRIDESSGIAMSSYAAGIYYTHNDSGDSARFFAVNSSGATLAVYTLPGATNVDWEDMAAGTDATGKPVLYFADIGDNQHTRKEIDVYQVAEPHGPSADLTWVRYRFRYPDGPHDAETLLVDPRSHHFFFATKELLRNGELYAAPAALSTTDVNVLTPLRSVPPLTTSGDFSPDGRRVVLLTYLRAYWAADIGAPWHGFGVPLQQQDEAIAFTRDGSSVLVGSEGVHSAVYAVPFPTTGSAQASSPAAKPATAPAAATPHQASPSTLSTAVPTDRHSDRWWWAAVAAAAVVLAGVAGFLRRRRSGDRAVHVADRDRDG
jgi:hypothetical protein